MAKIDKPALVKILQDATQKRMERSLAPNERQKTQVTKTPSKVLIKGPREVVEKIIKDAKK